MARTRTAWGAQTSPRVLGLRMSAAHSCLVSHSAVVPNHTVLQVTYLETMCQKVPSSGIQLAETHCIASYQAFGIGVGSCLLVDSSVLPNEGL